MSDPARTTLRVLHELERRDAEARTVDSTTTAEPPTATQQSSPAVEAGQAGHAGQAGSIGAAQMLEALVATDFDLPAAMVRLRRDA